MTQEEKARAYDEAIRKAQDISHTSEFIKITDLFPQLSESEDEKIREFLIGILSQGTWRKEWPFSPNEVVAYLERQNHVQSDTEKEYVRTLKSLIFNFLSGKQEVDRNYYQRIEDWLDGRHVEQKEQKPKQVPKWLYRLEFKDNSCGLWYNGQGEWCFENGIGSLDDSCKTKNLPMDYDERYKQDGRNWFSSCSKKEDLLHWYSKEDAKTLLNKGFVFTRYLATEYHEYDQQTVFIKETALYREEINFLELMKEQKPAEWSDEDEQRIAEIEFAVMQMNTKRVDTKDKCLTWLKSLRPQSKQEWSEEDERILKGIIGLIDHDQHYGVSNNEMISWLKTLRPQLKQKWSEEDKKMLWIIQLALTKHTITDKQEKDAFDWLNSLRPQPQTKTNDYITPHKKFFQWIYNRLVDVHGENPNVDYMRSFKERIDNLQFDEPHWKPSEDEERLINTSISFLKDFADKGYENAVECIDWLKSKLNGNTCK